MYIIYGYTLTTVVSDSCGRILKRLPVSVSYRINSWLQ